jgi:hypothetical protein
VSRLVTKGSATGYATTLVAVGSVVLLWWGGAGLVRWLVASIQ